MTESSTEKVLLFGVMAHELGFVSRDDLLTALQTWVGDKTRPLGEILERQGRLKPQDRQALDLIVERHVEHHGDVRRSLAALPRLAELRESLKRLGDPDLTFTVISYETVYDTVVPQPGGDGTGATAAWPARVRFVKEAPHKGGGMGDIFRARDRELDRVVALKEIKERYADNPEARARFLVEAEITGALEHPGIVPVYSLGRYPDGRPYYAMRFIQGESLHDALAQFHAREASLSAGDRALELRGLLTRFVAICNVLAYAHSRGIVHRDLKPHNVMLGAYGETLVIDWGLAKGLGKAEHAGTTPVVPASQEGLDRTRYGEVKGTLAYMAPEQAEGVVHEIGPASDIYSLGGTLYSVLTGRAPAEGHDVYSVLKKVREGEFPPPRQVKPSVPVALESICLKAMARRLEHRYPSAKALADDVDRWLADEPPVAHRESTAERVARFARKHRALVRAAAVALTVIALVSVAAAILINQAEEKKRQADALSDLKETFNARIEQFSWNQQAPVERLLRRLEPLDEEYAKAAQARYHQALDRAVRAELAEQLTEGALDRVSRRVDEIEELAPAVAAPLRQLLEDRKGQWHEVFALHEPFDTGAHLKDTQARAEGHVLKREGAGLPPHVSTKHPSAGFVRLKGTFEDWQSAPAVGLLLNHADEQGYQLVVCVPEYRPRDHDQDLYRPGWIRTLGQLGGERDPARLRILRNGITLAEASVSLPAGGRLTMTAQRENDRLLFQVNDFPAIEFQDPFPIAANKPGFFGVFWPRGVKLVRLLGEKKFLARKSSPLEEADGLMAEAEFDQARALYEKSATPEARFKQAYCLWERDRHEEAAGRLEALVKELPRGAQPVGQSAWYYRAGYLLWLHYLKSDEVDKADVVLANLGGGHQVEKLAPLIPAHLRVEVLDKYRFRGPIWRAAYLYGGNLEKMQRAARLEDDLGESTAERRFTRWRLMACYRANAHVDPDDAKEVYPGRKADLERRANVFLAEAIAEGRNLLLLEKWPDLEGDHWERVTLARELVWCLLQAGQSDAALQVVDSRLAGARDEASRLLLLDRARVLVALGQAKKAEAYVEEFFAKVSLGGLDYAEFADACLLRGFLRLDRGDRQGAEKAWAEGLARHWPGGLPAPPHGRVATVRGAINRTNAVTYSLQLASLTKTSTEAEAILHFNNLLTGTGLRMDAIRAIARKNMSAAFLRDLFLHLNSGLRGIDLARRMTYRKAGLRDFYVGPMYQTLYAACRAGAFPEDVTPKLDQVIYEESRNLIESFQKQTLSERGMELIVQLWFHPGNPADDWKALDERLDPSLRVPLADLFGSRFAARGLPHYARPFFEEVADRRRSPFHTYLRQEAVERLGRLGNAPPAEKQTPSPKGAVP